MTATRKLACAATALALVAGACGGNGDNDGSAAPAEAGSSASPVTIPIAIDGRPDDFATSLFKFFPSEVRAHPGDTIEFTSRFGGEPHTVAFGRLVDEALTLRATVPSGTPFPQNVRDALNKLPDFFDNEAPVLPLSEPLPAGAMPCFVATGDPPTREACANQQQPAAFTGQESLFASGFLPDEATFSVKLADDIAPGTYRFIDLVQGVNQTGSVTVVDPATPIPTPEQVAEQGRAEFEAVVAQLRPAAEQIQASTSPQALVGTKVEGVEVPHDVNVFPEEISVGVGQSVSWTVTSAHTVSFNAPEDARPLYVEDGRGGAAANRKGADPAGGPGQPPPDPDAPPSATPIVVDGGSFDGQGYRNSGLLVSLGTPVEYRLTFTTPGTYKYRCNFHLDMEGVVKVG
jgi:plastocyanin